MSISPETVRFDEDAMWVELRDGRTIGVPLAWPPASCARARPSARLAHSAAAGCIGRRWTRMSQSPAS
jgi:hypothetical protein